MMSNLLELAQTTRPQAISPLNAMLLVLVLVGIPFSLQEIRRRRLWQLPASPATPIQAKISVLAGIMLAAAASYFFVGVLSIRLLGLTTESVKTPSAMRLVIMCQPLAQAAALLVILGLLETVHALPKSSPWCFSPRRGFATALGCYLLAIPWVLLSGIVIQLLIQFTGIKTEQSHLIFDIWKNEASGITLFKATAFFSVTILAPLVEELFFRGLMQRFFYQISDSPFFAVVAASLAFASTHQPWPIQPPIFILALVLGWTYFRTGNLLLVIVIHSLFNLLQIGLFTLNGI